MRRSWARHLRCLGAVLLLSGCGSTELAISFNVPAGYRAKIKSTNLRVIEPPIAEPFDCESIAYAVVDPEVVRVATVFEISGAAGDRISIGQVDRIKPKIFWADGKGADGTTLVTGCAELGEITESIILDIAAEPVVVVGAPSEKALIFQQGMMGATPSVSLDAVDRLGAALPDVSAKWKVVGAGDMGSQGEARAQTNGRIVIAPPAPPRAGPFVLAVRVRWASTPVVSVSGAVTPSKETIHVMGRATDYLSGRIGPQKEPGIAALVTVNGEERVQLAYRSGATFIYRTSDRLSPMSKVFLLDMHGAAPDRILAISADEWVEIGADGLLTRRPAYVAPLLATPTGIFAAEDCLPGSAPLIAVSYDRPVIGIYSAEGVHQGTHFLDLIAEDISASGCVGTADQHVLRAFVLGRGSIPLLTVAQTGAGSDFFAGGWIALSSGIGFSPGASPLMLGTQINGNDLVIARARLKLGEKMTADELVVENLGTDPIPFPYQPVVTTAGEIDGDGRLDVVSLMSRSQQGQPNQYQLWTILGLENDRRRIAGPMIPSIGLVAPTLLLGDMDGDNISDVILGEAPTTGTESAIEIYRLGAMD